MMCMCVSFAFLSPSVSFSLFSRMHSVGLLCAQLLVLSMIHESEVCHESLRVLLLFAMSFVLCII